MFSISCKKRKYIKGSRCSSYDTVNTNLANGEAWKRTLLDQYAPSPHWEVAAFMDKIESEFEEYVEIGEIISICSGELSASQICKDHVCLSPITPLANTRGTIFALSQNLKLFLFFDFFVCSSVIMTVIYTDSAYILLFLKIVSGNIFHHDNHIFRQFHEYIDSLCIKEILLWKFSH